MCDLKRDKKYSWSMYLAICGVIAVGVVDNRVWGGLFHLNSFVPSLYLVVERLLQLITLPIMALAAMWLLVRSNREGDVDIPSAV